MLYRKTEQNNLTRLLTGSKDQSNVIERRKLAVKPSQVPIVIQIYKADWSTSENLIRNIRKEALIMQTGFDETLVSDKTDNHAQHFVAMLNARTPAGSISLTNDGQIHFIAVNPKYRKSGIGSKLIAAIEEFAKSRGIKKVHIHVPMSTETFFENRGFNNAGFSNVDRHVPYLLMVKKL